MEKIKLKLKNEEFKTFFSVLVELNKDEHLSYIQKIIIKEVGKMIFDKAPNDIIKISLYPSQAFVLFQLLDETYFDTTDFTGVVSSAIQIQIEDQLFKKSQLGFDILKDVYTKN